MSGPQNYRIFDFVGCLESHSSTPLMDVRVFLSVLLQRPVAEIFTDVALTDVQHQQLLRMLNRRVCGEPVAYIVGHVEFWGLVFTVGPGVLIPRPDTECLVEAVLTHYALHSGCRCLDLGMGCGVLALTLAHCFQHWAIDGVERSQDAMDYALINHQRHTSVASRVRMWHADWCQLPEALRQVAYDVVVANPPYIALDDPEISEPVHQFEPHVALYSADDGLADLQAVIELSTQLLRADGRLYLEHGYRQGQMVRSLLSQAGFSQVTTMTDMAGYERVTFGTHDCVVVHK